MQEVVMLSPKVLPLLSRIVFYRGGRELFIFGEDDGNVVEIEIGIADVAVLLQRLGDIEAEGVASAIVTILSRASGIKFTKLKLQRDDVCVKWHRIKKDDVSEPTVIST